jgi:hypothetical protein
MLCLLNSIFMSTFEYELPKGKIDGSEPAQSTFQKFADGSTIQTFGLSIRAHFAAIAMQGMLHKGAMTEHGVISQAPDTIAMLAVNQADALISALNK